MDPKDPPKVCETKVEINLKFDLKSAVTSCGTLFSDRSGLGYGITRIWER